MFRKIHIIIALCLLFLSSFLFSEIVILSSTEIESTTITVVESEDDFTIVEFSLNNYFQSMTRIDDQELYTFNITGGGITLQAGYPQLPIAARSLIVPHDGMMHFEILETKYTEISGNIVPSRGPLKKTDDLSKIPFTFGSVYDIDKFYPEVPVRLNEPYIMRELRGIAFQILPFSVNPVSETIRIYDRIVVKIYSDGIDTIDILPGFPTLITSDFVSIYRNHFINYQNFDERYDAITEKGTKLVISFDAYMTAMQPYVNWKNQNGIPTTMVSRTTAGSTATDIRNYIINHWNANPTLAFVQLVGDAPTQVPTFTYAGGGSDPSFGMILGGASNHYPDLLVGRFSAESVADVETQVLRSIHYERDLLDGDWLSRATGIASNEGGGWSGWLGLSDIQLNNQIRARLLNYNYISVDQIYQGQAGYSIAAVTDALNAGRGYVNYTGHGELNNWTSPNFTSTHIDQLTNFYKLPFIVSVACQNGNFVSRSCFAERWLRARSATGEPRGAIAALMGSIDQPWDPPMKGQDEISVLLTSGQKNTIGGLFLNGSSSIIDVFNNSSGWETVRTWNVFGDVSLMVRTLSPEVMNITAIPMIFLGVSSYEVCTGGIADARVTLYNPDTNQIVATGYTNEFGEVSLDLSGLVQEITNYTLTVSAYNKVTHIQNVPVTPSDDPFLVYNSMSYLNETSALYGSRVDIDISVRNAGLVDATNVVAILTTDDEFINIIHSEVSVATINASSTLNLNTFSFDVCSFILDQHRATFTLVLSDAEQNSWNLNFDIVFDAPTIEFLTNAIVITDIDGLLSSKLLPGQSYTIHVNYKNTGTAISSIGTATLITNNPYITISESIADIATIDPANTSTLQHEIFISPDTPIGAYINFGISAQFTHAEVSSYFYRSVNPLIEDFSTGDLSAFNWNNTAAIPWVITGTESYNGAFSLVSGNLIHNQSSTISITQVSDTPASISFWYKVSSEPVYDRLQFAINNVTVGEYSGEVDWTFVSFPVSVGTNEFRWRYRKNDSITAGADRAWIDMITFPSAGISIPDVPIIVVVSDPLNFSTSVVSEAVKNFTLKNLGNVAMTGFISAPTGFTISSPTIDSVNELNYAIPSGQSITYQLVFTTSLTNYAGVLSITSNDPYKPLIELPISANVSDVDMEMFMPLVSALLGNYPNPFNPETTISFYLAGDNFSTVIISIYNIRGQRVKQLVDDIYVPGYHSVVWDGKDDIGRSVGSGIYMYRLQTDGVTATRKMILIK
jgi:hypothetical protein